MFLGKQLRFPNRHPTMEASNNLLILPTQTVEDLQRENAQHPGIKPYAYKIQKIRDRLRVPAYQYGHEDEALYGNSSRSDQRMKMPLPQHNISLTTSSASFAQARVLNEVAARTGAPEDTRSKRRRRRAGREPPSYPELDYSIGQGERRGWRESMFDVMVGRPNKFTRSSRRSSTMTREQPVPDPVAAHLHQDSAETRSRVSSYSSNTNAQQVTPVPCRRRGRGRPRKVHTTEGNVQTPSSRYTPPDSPNIAGTGSAPVIPPCAPVLQLNNIGKMASVSDLHQVNAPIHQRTAGTAVVAHVQNERQTTTSQSRNHAQHWATGYGILQTPVMHVQSVASQAPTLVASPPSFQPPTLRPPPLLQSAPWYEDVRPPLSHADQMSAVEARGGSQGQRCQEPATSWRALENNVDMYEMSSGGDSCEFGEEDTRAEKW